MTDLKDAMSAEQRERVGRASARLQKTQQMERDKDLAWKEIAASTRRTDENTTRLRALRLQKETEDAAAKAAEAALKPPSRTRKKSPAR
jgi:uncharacterized protein YwgA